jgi:hypothetical protein
MLAKTNQYAILSRRLIVNSAALVKHLAIFAAGFIVRPLAL